MHSPIAAKVIQQWLGVTSDGEWGPQTEAAIRAKLGNPKDDTGRPWGRKRLTYGAQQAILKEAGFPIVVDGLMGPETIDALERWQNGQKAEGMALAGASELSFWQRFTNWWFSEDDTLPAKISPTMVKPALLPSKPLVDTTLRRQSWPRLNEVAAFYGERGVNQTRIQLPYPMKLAWDKKVPVGSFVCHQKVAPSVLRCLSAVKAHYTPEQISTIGLDLFGGCLNVRKVRGGNTWSMHSWGIAIDFDPDRNQLRWGADRARLAKPDAKAFWEIWEAEGWTSLGRHSNFDFMHVEAVDRRR